MGEVMRRVLVLVLIACALADPAYAARHKKKAPGAATESLGAQLAKGEALFEEYQYQQAAAVFRAILDQSPADAKVRQRAMLMLALTLYYAKDEAGAGMQLKELFRENVDHPFDRELFHPDLVRFYDTERNAYLEGLEVQPKQIVADPVVSSPPSAPAALPLETHAALPQTLGDRHPWLRIFPIVGHFANYDHVGGAVFLALELALIGMNVGGAVARVMLRYPEGDYRPGAAEARIIQNVGGIGAIVLTVICIVDAFAWSPARGRAAHQKALSEPTVDLGPLGDYRLSFVIH
jgi:hypothetical protein